MFFETGHVSKWRQLSDYFSERLCFDLEIGKHRKDCNTKQIRLDEEEM